MRCRSSSVESLYLDSNASAPVHPAVLETYVRVAREAPANPASLHRAGRRAQGVLEESRERIARLLRSQPREILFTGGATEANNLALLGAARAAARLHGRPCVLIASRAEHPAVLSPLRRLQQEGHPLHLVPLDPSARVRFEDLSAAIEEARPGVVALQWANNETGAVQPIRALAESLGSEVHFHCDAVQGFGKLPWDEGLEQAQTLALSGHKFRAPKGVGVLRVREDAFLDPVLTGGGQQRNLRPGTENAAAAAACAHALELAFDAQAEFAQETQAACTALLRRLRELLPELQCNHPDDQALRLPNTLNVSFSGIDGRALLPACDVAGLSVSSGAACSSGSAQPSAVLLACGVHEDLARASLRITFGWGQNETTGVEAANRIAVLVKRLYKHAKR